MPAITAPAPRWNSACGCSRSPASSCSACSMRRYPGAGRGAPEEARDFVEHWMEIARPVLRPIPEGAASGDILSHYEGRSRAPDARQPAHLPWIEEAVTAGRLTLRVPLRHPHRNSFPVGRGQLRLRHVTGRRSFYRRDSNRGLMLALAGSSSSRSFRGSPSDFCNAGGPQGEVIRARSRLIRRGQRGQSLPA